MVRQKKWAYYIIILGFWMIWEHYNRYVLYVVSPNLAGEPCCSLESCLLRSNCDQCHLLSCPFVVWWNVSFLHRPCHKPWSRCPNPCSVILPIKKRWQLRQFFTWSLHLSLYREAYLIPKISNLIPTRYNAVLSVLEKIVIIISIVITQASPCCCWAYTSLESNWLIK